MANVSITQLPAAQTLTGSESVPIVQNGVTVQTTTGAIANSPVLTQTFLTVGAQPQLANSRYFTVGSGMTVVDGGASGPFSVELIDAPLSLVTSLPGFQVKTSVNTLVNRSLSVGSGMSITNASGVDGDPVISLVGLMSNLAALSGTGLIAINGALATPVVLTGTTGQINVANGNGAGGAPTFSLAPSGVVAGSYTLSNITVDATGRVTSASNGTAAGSGTVTLVNTGVGLTGGPISTSGTISLADTAVAAGTYGSATQVAQLTVNAQGQLTAASNVTIANIPNSSLTNSSVTINGVTVALGGSGTITTAAANPLTIGTGLSGGSYNGSAAVTIAIDSTVATLTGSQTLTNKTLTSPTINTPTLSGGSINNAIIGASVPAAATFTSATLTSGTIATAPTNGLDIVNKDYADSIASGLNYHQPVVYASTAALPAYIYNNGASGVGATITAVAPGALSIGGGSPTTTQRVLVKDEVGGNAAYNGVYTVTATGSAISVFQLTRALDYDTSGAGSNEIDAGDYVLVISGTNASTAWVQQTGLPITVGTTPLVFLQFNQPITYSAGTGLNLSPATTFNISNTGVTAATYGSASSVPVLAVNAQGQLTSVTNTTIAIANTAVSGLGTMSTQAASSVAITGGSVNGTTVGATTASTGAFTTLSASSTVSGTGFSTYLASPPAIGGTAPAAGSFTTLNASSTATLNTLVSSGATITGGTIDGTTIGATTATTGAFTTVTATTGIFGGTF